MSGLRRLAKYVIMGEMGSDGDQFVACGLVV